jgi:signal transduction histidine kinase
MKPSTPVQVPRRIKVLVSGILLLMTAFGGLTSVLPSHLIQPVVSMALALANLVALALLFLRSRDPGPERLGWRLMALSVLGNIAANTVLLFTPSPLVQVSPAEMLYFGLQVAIALVQAGALLSWPFQRTPYRSSRIRDVLGGLIFAGSLFLLLWTTNLWQEWDHGRWPVFVRIMGLSIRVAIVGGIAAYFLAGDPRRVRGPLGWIFTAAVITVAAVLLLRSYLYDANAVLQPSWVFGLLLVIPLTYAAAAWLEIPVEVPEDLAELPYNLVEVMLYLPFAAVGGTLILTALLHHSHLLHQLIGFVLVSTLLLFRQFLLLREVRLAKFRLEERVLTRTRNLEDLQGIMLRTERMNAVGAMGAGLAHDLNNALAGIRVQAELARTRVENGLPPSVSDLDRILVAADQSTTLTGRLMAFARQEEESLSPLDLAAETSKLENILRMLLTRQISLSLDLGSGPALIHGSRNHIEQVLVNLIGNARDAMPQGGTITLRIRVEAEAVPPVVRLEVGDTGSGMGPEVLAHLFQPFFTTKAPGKGTGLGLASVKHLIEDVNGSIHVHSVPDQGTLFTLRFPLLR